MCGNAGPRYGVQPLPMSASSRICGVDTYGRRNTGVCGTLALLCWLLAYTVAFACAAKTLSCCLARGSIGRRGDCSGRRYADSLTRTWTARRLSPCRQLTSLCCLFCSWPDRRPVLPHYRGSATLHVCENDPLVTGVLHRQHSHQVH